MNDSKRSDSSEGGPRGRVYVVRGGYILGRLYAHVASAFAGRLTKAIS